MNFECVNLKSMKVPFRNKVFYVCDLDGCTNKNCKEETQESKKEYTRITNRDFKVGDRVRIRQWDDMANEFGVNGIFDFIQVSKHFTPRMKFLCGKECIITAKYNGIISLKFEEDVDAPFKFSVGMVEHI